ncbi:MAG TPA: type II secretion system protein [Planctomycetota bacterium]|nr:type II secretion system protein [Planctomycetota bacterium]
MRHREAGITLVEIVAAVTIIGILSALLIPLSIKAGRYENLKLCQDNLRTLYAAQAKAPPTPTQEYGRAYWVRLTQMQPPLLSPDRLRCPFVDGADAPFCQYFGPAGDIVKYDAKDPIGCDMELSHSDDGRQGGSVVLKNGDVVTDHTGAWGSAQHGGRCRP